MNAPKPYAGPFSQVVGGSVLALTRAGGRVARRLVRRRSRRVPQPSPTWPAAEPVVPEPAVQPGAATAPEVTEPEPVTEPVAVAAEPVPEPVTEPVAVAAEPEPVTEPVAVAAEPVAEPEREPKARKTTRRASSKPQPPEGFVPISERPVPSHVFIPGPYSLEVVGESFVKANLEALVGVPAPQQGRTYTSGKFQLVPYRNPYDPLAVEVRELSSGLPVGHLPRAVAGKLHRPLAELARQAGRPVAVSGTIFGGKGRYGVRVYVDLERLVRRRVARKVPHRLVDHFPLGNSSEAIWNAKSWVFD